jgi:HEAT repeat protein
VLLDRLERAAAQDRDALAIAVAGPVAAATDAAVVARVVALAGQDASPRRDALIEAAGAAPGPLAVPALSSFAARSVDPSARAKVAEALAGKPEALKTLLDLARDGEPSVRANAVWALGSLADAAAGEPHVQALRAALADADAAVASNAAAALGRLLVRGVKLAPVLCAALTSGRAYVRANALAGLRHAGVRCAGGEERVLLDDSVDLVRAAAARLVAVTPTAEDRVRLARCVDEEVSPDVAAACAASAAAPGTPHRTPGGLTVYVVPAGGTEPVPRAAFALVLPDGFVRLGQADLRGSVFERDAPKGTFRLALAAPFVD